MPQLTFEDDVDIKRNIMKAAKSKTSAAKKSNDPKSIANQMAKVAERTIIKLSNFRVMRGELNKELSKITNARLPITRFKISVRELNKALARITTARLPLTVGAVSRRGISIPSSTGGVSSEAVDSSKTYTGAGIPFASAKGSIGSVDPFLEWAEYVRKRDTALDVLKNKLSYGKSFSTGTAGTFSPVTKFESKATYPFPKPHTGEFVNIDTRFADKFKELHRIQDRLDSLSKVRATGLTKYIEAPAPVRPKPTPYVSAYDRQYSVSDHSKIFSRMDALRKYTSKPDSYAYPLPQSEHLGIDKKMAREYEARRKKNVMSSTTTSITKFLKVFSGVSIAFLLAGAVFDKIKVGVADMIDTISRASEQITYSKRRFDLIYKGVGGQGLGGQLFRESLEASQLSGAGVDVFRRISIPLKDKVASGEIEGGDVAKVIRSIGLGLKVQGATDQEADRAAIQLQDIFARGRIQQEDWRRLLTAFDTLPSIIAEGLGITVSELQTRVSSKDPDEKIKTPDFIKALIKALPSLEKSNRELGSTLSESVSKFKTQFNIFASSFEQIATRFVSALSNMTKWLNRRYTKRVLKGDSNIKDRADVHFSNLKAKEQFDLVYGDDVQVVPKYDSKGNIIGFKNKSEQQLQTYGRSLDAKAMSKGARQNLADYIALKGGRHYDQSQFKGLLQTSDGLEYVVALLRGQFEDEKSAKIVQDLIDMRNEDRTGFSKQIMQHMSGISWSNQLSTMSKQNKQLLSYSGDMSKASGAGIDDARMFKLANIIFQNITEPIMLSQTYTMLDELLKSANIDIKNEESIKFFRNQLMDELLKLYERNPKALGMGAMDFFGNTSGLDLAENRHKFNTIETRLNALKNIRETKTTLFGDNVPRPYDREDYGEWSTEDLLKKPNRYRDTYAVTSSAAFRLRPKRNREFLRDTHAYGLENISDESKLGAYKSIWSLLNKYLSTATRILEDPSSPAYKIDAAKSLTRDVTNLAHHEVLGLTNETDESYETLTKLNDQYKILTESVAKLDINVQSAVERFANVAGALAGFGSSVQNLLSALGIKVDKDNPLSKGFEILGAAGGLASSINQLDSLLGGGRQSVPAGATSGRTNNVGGAIPKASSGGGGLFASLLNVGATIAGFFAGGTAGATAGSTLASAITGGTTPATPAPLGLNTRLSGNGQMLDGDILFANSDSYNILRV